MKTKADTSPPTRVTFEEPETVKLLYGENDGHLKLIEKALGVRIGARGNTVSISGDPESVQLTEKVLTELYEVLRKGHPVYPGDIHSAIRILSSNRTARLKDVFLDTVYISSKRRLITPKSLAQKIYIDAIRKHDIVFGIGPAGTGKTYLAMAMGVASLTKKEVDRIILTRPAVEAGEKLGFLPGDLLEKVNPYLRPLYDALHDMMDFEMASRLIEKGVIEVAPLAFMRGRTLNDSFVILDEAQNTTSEQMKMFLTRLGYSSKAVITGDITQIDLPSGKTSGLVEARSILTGIEGIDFSYFTEIDVVRHPLVQDIIRAYDQASRRNSSSHSGREASSDGEKKTGDDGQKA
ncbi:MAG TPA: PhoH family protein [Thermodesulfobacteriota bacterium]|nr:PhoH family protein [Thermodesulfobacteriota bacterium]